MIRNHRLVQLLFLAATGFVVGTIALLLLGPPRPRSSEPPRSFSEPLDFPAAGDPGDPAGGRPAGRRPASSR